MTGRRCAHVDACTASQGVLGGVCPITSRNSCTWYEPEIDRAALLEVADRMERMAQGTCFLHEMGPDLWKFARLIRKAMGS